jgi:RND family efflux transporter MFP subunit
MKRNHKIRVIGIISLAIILLFALAIYKGKSKSKIKASEKLPVTITAVSPFYGAISQIESYTGTLEGKEQADVISQTSGVIEKILFTPGQTCRIGQVLAIVENSQQEANVEQAKAQLMAAETNYEKAQKDYTRIQKLFEDNVTTRDNLEMSQLGVKSAYAQLKGAQASLKVAEKLYSDTQIKATINGRIATKLINIGQTLAPGMPIATLVNDSEFKLKVFIPEANISAMKVNQMVDITIDVLPELEIKGRIISTGLAFEGQGKSYPVEISIPHKGYEDIKAGMFARCKVITHTKDKAFLVDEKAVIVENNEYYVYIINGDKAVKTQIKTGLRDEEYYEVLEGLNENSKVVTDGKDQINEDSVIAIGEK